MQKTILVSLLTIGLLASVIGVGTYAYFSDTETSVGNTMTAGTLDLSVNGLNPLVGPVVTLSDMKPSKDMLPSTVTLRIVDNPGKLYKMITNITCAGGLHPESELAADPTDTINDLTADTWFDLTVDGKVCLVFNGAAGTGDKKIGDIANQWIYLGEFQNGTNVPVIQSFHLDKMVGNEHQGDNCTFNEVFQVEQTNAPPLAAIVDCTVQHS